MIREEMLFRIADDRTFEQAALETFRFQSERCAPYREYLGLIGCDPRQVQSVDDIPFLPIGVFKWREVYCGEERPEIVFTSSATTGMTQSRHPMRSLALYEEAFRTAFRLFYGEPRRLSLYALLPNYLEREGSSLIYMADRLIADCGSGGFYLHDYDRLLRDMAADPKPKILLGVSYALWELAERYAPKLEHTVVMETGGMKGRREELPKEEFHRILCDAFGTEAIHSEYGMAELTSQAIRSRTEEVGPGTGTAETACGRPERPETNISSRREKAPWNGSAGTVIIPRQGGGIRRKQPPKRSDAAPEAATDAYPPGEGRSARTTDAKRP